MIQIKEKYGREAECHSASDHLSHIQQVDLEEESQSAACDLIGSSTDSVADFAAYRQTFSLDLWLKENERGCVVESVYHLV